MPSLQELAARVSLISESSTLKVFADADRLRREGKDVVDFSAGEPDFPTPDAVKAAARVALDENFTRYTPPAGILELKRAICERYSSDYGVGCSENEVIVTAGGKQALYNTALTLFGPGDEVITHAPYWPTLTEQIKLADATPVLVRTHPEDGFAMHARAILGAVTPRTRGIIVNSPCNPTGALIAESELAELADFAAARRLWIVVDLVYIGEYMYKSLWLTAVLYGILVALAVLGLRDWRRAEASAQIAACTTLRSGSPAI